MRSRSHSVTYFKCQYCHYTISVPDAPYIGKCSCGGRRGISLQSDVVKCYTCAKPSPGLTERLREHRMKSDAAPKEVREHEKTEHRAEHIYDRMEEIERSVRRGWDTVTDEDWATHPVCIEHRALMREWWTLPNKAVASVLYGHNRQNNREVNTWRDRERKIAKLKSQSVLNSETGWYELPQTTFRFYLNADEETEVA